MVIIMMQEFSDCHTLVRDEACPRACLCQPLKAPCTPHTYNLFPFFKKNKK